MRYFGDYKLIREIGRGGMGIVYKSRQISLNRLVALKMIRSAALASESELRRFQNEAEAIALLDHPHIVPILEVGNHDGQRYFRIKLIGGLSLDKKLVDYTADPKSAARLLRTAAEAVHSRATWLFCSTEKQIWWVNAPESAMNGIPTAGSAWIDAVGVRLEWKQGTRPRVEHFPADVGETRWPLLLEELVRVERVLIERAGQVPGTASLGAFHAHSCSEKEPHDRKKGSSVDLMNLQESSRSPSADSR